MSDSERHGFVDGIAIVGMSARFPGANDVGQFWDNLKNGVESISRIPDSELLSLGVDPARLADSDYVKVKSALEGIALFDASFFEMNAREASLTDPQQRIFLECAWEAVESAGYSPSAYDGRVGVFGGVSGNPYWTNIAFDFASLDGVEGLQATIASDKDYLATRVSYKLNLTGPSITVQTACSSSLVAVSLACQSLLTFQCDMALAGGATVNCSAEQGYVYQEGGIASPDGHCRAFDAKAGGTVFGSGVGVVLLKRLEDAIADNDLIYAVIAGTAINNDGADKVGYTAPSVNGQAEVIVSALALAGIEPETVTYVEAHGTGTPLGDPIEVAALTQAFRTRTGKRGFCAIGSVKTNFGHLDNGAGVAGLIKTALALRHKQIPPSLHFGSPNPQIDFANSPFYVNTRLAEWKSDSGPRRAGVSSFGVGGTNAHVVLEEAPALEPSDPARPYQLLLLSARTDSALDAMTANLARHLRDNPGVNLADVAHTLQRGRKLFSRRRMVVCGDVDDAAKVLKAADSRRIVSRTQDRNDRPVAFMFTGQGSQYAGMAKDLYLAEPTFRAQVDSCCELLEPHLGLDLREAIFPSEVGIEGAGTGNSPSLGQTWLTQPALFVVEYALARLWMEWGVTPRAMIGHSIGEYVAACLAGVFSLDDALALVAARGRMMQGMPGGAMLSIALGEAQVRGLMGARLSIAAVNSPSTCVVSGTAEDVDEIEGRLNDQGADCQRLHTSHAFHSAMMDPILEAFTRLVRKVRLHAPAIPFVSNVTGTWISPAQAIDASYWASHLRQAVRFGEGVRELMKDPSLVLVEVGPGHTLTNLARRNLETGNERTVVPSLRPPQSRKSDVEFILEAEGLLWLAGVPIDWTGFYSHERRRRIPLPTYPFERKRYWLETGDGRDLVAGPGALVKKSEIADWFYVPSWRRGPSPADVAQPATGPLRWLMFADEFGWAEKLAGRLASEGDPVLMVHPGQSFEKLGDSSFSIDPGRAEHYEALFAAALDGSAGLQTRIVHLWAVTGGHNESARVPRKELLERSFWSPTCVAQALGRVAAGRRFEITFVSDGVQEVTGDERLRPEKATILGPCRVIPQEYPDLACRNVDVVLPEPGSRGERELLDQLCGELRSASTDPLVAYRGVHRWVRTHEPVRIPSPERRPSRLRDKGAYLITGGLGGIGLAIAEYLAASLSARLVLVGRTPLPDASDWDRWLASHGPDDKESKKIRRILAIEALGGQVMVASADVADRDQMENVVKTAKARFGEIHGVVHAAGVPARGIIELKTHEAASTILAPKIQGTLVLDEIFAKAELDFVVLCSSVGAVLGGSGQVDYAAANAFIDAYAQAKSGSERRLTVSIAWDAWSDSGMAVETVVPSSIAGERRKDLEAGIRDAEGVEVFRRVLDSSLSQVVVSTRDLQGRVDRSTGREYPQGGKAIVDEKTPASRAHSRPALSSQYEAPRNDAERLLADIWAQLLGLEIVGIHDEFFELGGDSLLGTRVISRVRQAMHVELSVRTLFEVPTVAGMAERIQAILLATQSDPTSADGADRTEIEL